MQPFGALVGPEGQLFVCTPKMERKRNGSNPFVVRSYGFVGCKNGTQTTLNIRINTYQLWFGFIELNAYITKIKLNS